MIRALAQIAAVICTIIGAFLVGYALTAVAQGGVVPLIMPSPPKPDFVMPAPLDDMIETVQLER